MADKQLAATVAASAYQKEWFADLRRRVFDDRQPYALVQADGPFELFDLVDVPAVLSPGPVPALHRPLSSRPTKAWWRP